MVTVGGVLQPALKWEHYKLQSDDQGIMTAARVWNEFWVIFVITCITRITNLFLFLGEVSFAGGGGAVPTKVVRDMMSNARMQYVCLYYKKIKVQDMNKK
jgi:hypothetical protein